MLSVCESFCAFKFADVEFADLSFEEGFDREGMCFKLAKLFELLTAPLKRAITNSMAAFIFFLQVHLCLSRFLAAKT